MNAILDTIPDKMGIYYIHNVEGKVIFIGRGHNLKSEVTKLFLKQSKRAIKIQERVDTVTYQFTGNELFKGVGSYP